LSKSIVNCSGAYYELEIIEIVYFLKALGAIPLVMLFPKEIS